MSDWLGVWDFSGVSPDASAGLEPSLKRLGLTRRESAQSSEVAAVGFATTGFEHRLHFARDAAGFAFVAGNLESPELNSAQHVLEQHRRWGDSFAAHLQGAFAVLLCDPLARKIVLVRDAVGTLPIYYAAVGNGVRFATRVAPLLEEGARRQPNLGALAELFIGGRWFGAGETLYAGVSVLPPGHMLTLDANGLRVRRHWEFAGYELRYDELEAYHAEFRRLLTQAVKRQLGARSTAVFVSGGLDSSAVFATAHQLSGAGAVNGITWSTDDASPTNEMRYIEALESRYGRIQRVPLHPTHETPHDDRDVLYSELPITNNMPATALRAYAAARRTGADVILDGAWGDHVLAPFPPLYLVSLLRRMNWLTATAHVRGYLRMQPADSRAAVLQQLARSAVRLHLPASLLDQRRARLNRRRDPGPFTDTMLTRLSGAELWEEWLPEDITPHARSVLQTVYHPAHPLRYECTNKLTALYGIESLQPFLDRELIAFLAIIPGTVHSRNGVPKAILRDSMTEWVPAAILQREDKGDATAALETGIRGSWTAYAERIAGSTCAFDWHILEPRRVQDRLAHLQQQRQIDSTAAAWQLIELYALVVWLETFFGAGPATSPRRSHERAQADGY